jgi:20S proteasome alpha/beta subunit
MVTYFQYRVLTNVGTFFYHKHLSSSHFYPLDCAEFFEALFNGSTSEQLVEILLNEYDLSESECIQICKDAIDSLNKENLLKDIDVVS